MRKLGLLFMTLITSSVGYANKETVLLDVRTQEEWNEKHIEGSTLVDFKQTDFKDKISRLDKDQTYEIYCRSGNRSGSAVKMMAEMGFKNVHNAGTIENVLGKTKSKCVGPSCSK